MSAETKEILLEAYKTTKKVSGIDPGKPGRMKEVLANDDAFNTYKEALAESIENKKDRENFKILAENTLNSKKI